MPGVLRARLQFETNTSISFRLMRRLKDARRHKLCDVDEEETASTSIEVEVVEEDLLRYSSCSRKEPVHGPSIRVGSYHILDILYRSETDDLLLSFIIT